MLMGLCGLLLLAACEESVNPILGTERAYTLYGFINPKVDLQAVRVFEIEGVLAREKPEPLTGAMALEERSTGQQVAWRDSVVLYANGQYGHVYYAHFRPAFDADYQITIESAEGKRTSVAIRTPPLVVPNQEEPVAAQSNVFLPILWQGAPRLTDAEVVYEVAYRSGSLNAIDTAQVTVDYRGQEQTAEGGWRVRVRLANDIGILYSRLFLQPGRDRLKLLAVEMHVLVQNEAWAPPGGLYDPEVLVEPGTFSNVENGFGFVGSAYPDSLTWLPPGEVAELAGFVLDLGEQ